MEWSTSKSKLWNFVHLNRRYRTWDSLCEFEFDDEVGAIEAIKRARDDIAREVKNIMADEDWYNCLVYLVIGHDNQDESEIFDKNTPAPLDQFISYLDAIEDSEVRFAMLTQQDASNKRLMNLLVTNISSNDAIAEICKNAPLLESIRLEPDGYVQVKSKVTDDWQELE